MRCYFSADPLKEMIKRPLASHLEDVAKVIWTVVMRLQAKVAGKKLSAKLKFQ